MLRFVLFIAILKVNDSLESLAVGGVCVSVEEVVAEVLERASIDKLLNKFKVMLVESI
jgi:hypothetical protein